MSRTTLVALALGVAFFGALVWAFLWFTETESPTPINGITLDDYHSGEHEPRRMPNTPRTSKREKQKVEAPQLTCVLKDKITGQPLGGVKLQSELGQLGPTKEDGVAQFPMASLDSKWMARLSDDYGGREVEIKVPSQEGEHSSTDIYIAAKCRLVVSFSSATADDPKDLSLVFGPKSLEHLPSIKAESQERMTGLMSKSPFLMHDWLRRRGLDDGRSGVVKSNLGEVATIDLNIAGAVNIVASTKSQSGALSVEAVAGEIRECVLSLNPSGNTVAGMVVDQDGKPLPGADIRIICTRQFAEGELLPDRDGKTNTVIVRDKYTGETVMKLMENTITDSEGRFSWKFQFTDAILIWAFYRDERSQFAGCGHYVSKAGEPRISDDVVVVVNDSMPFGASARLAGKKVKAEQVHALHFTDTSISKSKHANQIVAPLLIRGDKLLIDMLPHGQSCELWTQVGNARFVASPDAEILVK